MDTVDTTALSISPLELGHRIREGRAPLLLDVCRAPRFAMHTHMLAGATRCLPEDVGVYAATHTPQEVVVYCVFGHEVGQGAAQTLRLAGWDAKYLAGGIIGGEDGVDTAHAIAQWRATPVPQMAKRADLGVTALTASRWITRERPKIDRIACPWLIRRFVDPSAVFYYVPTAQVFDEAQRLQATAYDIPGAPISHTGLHGELCSFDALITAFDLHIPALDLLARIVRGADTDHLELAAQSAGLLAMSLGMSKMHSQDDHAMLAAMMPLYDALYQWCVQSLGHGGETHSWNPNPTTKTA